MVAVQPRSLKVYTTPDGRAPFLEWLDSLKDLRSRAAIRTRLDRVEAGNLGDCRSIGEGVRELRVHFGPGYRVYFGEQENYIVVLLCSGTKRTQGRDIERAKNYWQDYRSREDA